MTKLKITEQPKKSISTVYAYYNIPVDGKKCEWWSAFNGTYPLTKEREFISEIEMKTPNTFSHYLIAWDDCN